MKLMELALALQRQIVIIDLLKQQDIPYSADFSNWKMQTEALLKKAQEPDFLYLFQELCRTEKDSRTTAPRDRYLRYQAALIGSRDLLNRLVEKLTSPIEPERSPEEVYEELRRRLSQVHAFVNTLKLKRTSIWHESSLIRAFSVWEFSDPGGSVSSKDIGELEQRFCALRDAVEVATGDESLSASLELIPADLSVARRERIERLIAMANELLEYVKSWVEDPQDTIENLKAQIEAMSRREAGRIERLSSQRVDEVYVADFFKAELEEEKDSLRKQLAIHQKNLNELEVRKARYGMDPPLAILNEIDYIKEQIAKKRERLEKIVRLHEGT